MSRAPDLDGRELLVNDANDPAEGTEELKLRSKIPTGRYDTSSVTKEIGDMVYRAIEAGLPENVHRSFRKLPLDFAHIFRRTSSADLTARIPPMRIRL